VKKETNSRRISKSGQPPDVVHTGIREVLDDVDIHILRLLQEDGRITNADLARIVGLSAPSVLQRVRKLEELGVIRGYSTLLSPEAVGFGLTVFVQISLQLHQDQPISRFLRSIRALPEVLECYHVSGEFDFLVKVAVRDVSSYQKLVIERLSQIKGIGKIESCFVLGTEKFTLRLPLE
jgi:Lrp/AsnC family leucine-responsive transcriptional regulator